MPLANQGTHGPVTEGYETGHLVPGIVDLAVVVGRFLPVVDLIARDAGLQDQVGIAPDGIEGIILDGAETLKDARQVGWRKVVEGEQAAGLLARDMQCHIYSKPCTVLDSHFWIDVMCSK